MVKVAIKIVAKLMKQFMKQDDDKFIKLVDKYGEKIQKAMDKLLKKGQNEGYQALNTMWGDVENLASAMTKQQELNEEKKEGSFSTKKMRRLQEEEKVVNLTGMRMNFQTTADQFLSAYQKSYRAKYRAKGKITEMEANSFIDRLSFALPINPIREAECKRRLKSALMKMEGTAYGRIDNLVRRIRREHSIARWSSIMFGLTGFDRFMNAGINKNKKDVVVGIVKLLCSVAMVCFALYPLFTGGQALPFVETLKEAVGEFKENFDLIVGGGFTLISVIWWVSDVYRFSYIPERARIEIYRDFMATLRGIRRDIAIDRDPLLMGY